MSSGTVSGALSGLAPRIGRAMVFTVAPHTPLLAAMHAVGKMFPRADRAPMILPVAESRLRQACAAAPALTGFSVSSPARIERGFYRSQAYVLQSVAGASYQGGASR